MAPWDSTMIRSYCTLLAALLLIACQQAEPLSPSGPGSAASYSAIRLGDGPIIAPQTDASIGYNIQGPSLIRVPDWVQNPLGRYYLYFADHKGSYIRLAYADRLEGPWRIHGPGALNISDTPFPQTPPTFTTEEMASYRARATAAGLDLEQFPDLAREMTTPHVASPDVHVDAQNKRIVMYYHGLEGFARQVTRAAVSSDGIHFASGPEILGKTYWRAFPHDGMTYAIAMPGVFYRSADPLADFEEGPSLFNPDMRHAAIFQRGQMLYVVWSQVAADPPERLMLSTIDISGPWSTWQVGGTVELLRPETDWEGANLPLARSARSFAPGRVNQLRDPAIFEEDGRIFLLYAVAGESGIALAELKPN